MSDAAGSVVTGLILMAAGYIIITASNWVFTKIEKWVGRDDGRH